MSDRRKRMALTLSPKAYLSISRLAKAQDRSMVSVVNDFLDEFQPYFEDIAISLEMVKQGNDPTHILHKIMGSALSDAGSILSDAAATAEGK